MFCNQLDEVERAGCSTLFVFLMSCDCKCSVSLPHGAQGWSAVCASGIFCSYLLVQWESAKGLFHCVASTVTVCDKLMFPVDI